MKAEAGTGRMPCRDQCRNRQDSKVDASMMRCFGVLTEEEGEVQPAQWSMVLTRWK
jgi:hypothetical protein